MLDTKTWLQSRTIWLQIVSALFAILAAFHILPTGLDQEQVVGAIMGAVAIATLVLRIRSTHAIVSPFRVASPASTPAAASIAAGITDEATTRASVDSITSGCITDLEQRLADQVKKPKGIIAKALAIGVPAILLAGLSACATPGAGTAPTARIALVAADFERARAFAAPFISFLPPEWAARVRALAVMVEQALASARSATSAEERNDALRAAEAGTKDYRFATGG